MSTVAQAETDVPVSSSSFLDNVKDVTAGAAGGIAQVLIGQPFDIVKVRLQTQGGSNALGVTSHILLKEGPLAFYKGTLMPLLGIGACVSIQFGAFHAARRAFEDYNIRNHGQRASELSLGQYYLAGAFGGVMNSVISTPVEHIRIRLQTQPHGAARIYTGPGDCVRQVVAKSGVWGLYRGNVPCLYREFHGFGLWFVTYEALLKYDMSYFKRTRSEVPLWSIALYGGLAGEMLWFGTYPIDVIKSRMQNDGFGKDQKYRLMRVAFSDLWQQQGMKGFWRGIVPTLVRTMLTSGATFVTAEQVKYLLG